MYKADFFRQIKPYLLGFLTFFAFTVYYCLPAFQGKTIVSSDGVQFGAMLQGVSNDVDGIIKYSMWNRNLFSGMPFFFENQEMFNAFAYFISNTLFNIISKLLLINVFNWTSTYFLTSCICFYILTLVLRFNNTVAIISSLAYAFALQTSILLIAGHHTKLMSMALLPLLVCGFVLITRKQYFIGALMGTIAMKIIISFEHYQMVFYSLVVLLFLSAAYLINCICVKDKEKIRHVLLVVAASVSMVLISSLFYFPKLMSYLEYSKETIRSGSKIRSSSAIKIDGNIKKEDKHKSGLSKDYAFAWSYGINETFTFVAPDAYGACSSGRLDENSNIYKNLIDKGVDEENAINITKSLSTYWGEQPFTLGPIYFGVIICFFAVLASFYLRGWFVWGIVSLCITTIFVSWGKNFSSFNYLLFDTIPYYNRFRAPTMILTITQFSIVLLAAFGLQKLFVEKSEIIFNKKFLKISAYILGGFFVATLLFFMNADFTSSNDKTMMQQLMQMTGGNKSVANDIYKSIKADRQALLKSNIISMLLMSVVLFVFMFFYVRDKLKLNLFLLLIGATIMFDYFKVNSIYVNESKFSEQLEVSRSENGYIPQTEIDKQILQDQDSNYRVWDLSSDGTYNDASISNYHRSIGGYFAAKLALYQDLIDSQLSRYNMSVANMLNTRYIIKRNENGDRTVIKNPNAMGPCWIVKNINFVEDTRSEMMALNNFDPKKDAFVLKYYRDEFKEKIKYDSFAKIENTLTSNDKMEYQSSSKSTQFAVFSEIFYDKGWKAFIDDQEVPIIKTNYVLRGLTIPPGNHKIKFEFQLHTFKKYTYVVSIAAVLFTLLVIFSFYFEFIPWYKKEFKHKN